MPPNSEIEKLERRWRDNPKGTVFAPYAEVLRKNGDHAMSRDVLRQGLELHPDHIPGNIVLGRCCLDLGEDGPAEAAFAHVLDLDPENVIALKALADITERQGRLAEADNWLARLISVDPSNDEARDQFSRVTGARDAAAAALAPELVSRQEASSSTVPTREIPVTLQPVLEPDLELQDRSEADIGEIDDVGDVAAFADEALDSFLDLPSESTPPEGRILPPVELETTAITPVFSARPEPLAGLVPAELDLTAVAREIEPIADLRPEQEFAPPEPAPPPPRPSGPYAIGVETAAEIELRPTGASEFQAPDDSTALLDITPGKSEFQVPDASSDLKISAGGKSEFQTPDASDELRISGHGSSGYQPPSGAEELLESAGATASSAPESEPPSGDTGWGNSGVPSTLATMAAMPTEELPTEPPAVEPSAAAAPASAPSWFFDDEEPRAPAAAADLPPIASEVEPQPEPEPAAAMASPPAPELADELVEILAVATPEPVESEPEPELVAQTGPRSSAELRLIFPDDAAQPEPHRVRRITQADIAPPKEVVEPAAGEPEPVMTETMAELYARQGHTAEALRVYHALAEKQPGDARLRDRIRELEARGASVQRRHTFVAVDTGGESVESFFRSLAEARPGSGGVIPGFEPGGADDNSGAPTRPARDPLSLSAIFGEEPAARAPAKMPEGAEAGKSAGGTDAFSFDQFFGGPSTAGHNSAPARPSGASEEDLDQFQNWLKSLKR